MKCGGKKESISRKIERRREVFFKVEYGTYPTFKKFSSYCLGTGISGILSGPRQWWN
jgi:hypothetical protein